MRPRDELRQAMLGAWQGLGAATWLDAWQATGLPISKQAAKRTAHNMVAAEELQVLGTVAVPGVNRPMLLLALAERETQASRAEHALMDVTAAWASL